MLDQADRIVELIAEAWGKLAAVRLHALALPEKFTLCLVWSGRNVATRPALAELVDVLSETLTAA